MTPKQARRRGVLLIILGLFLMVLIGTVTAIVLDFIPLSFFFPGTYRDPNADTTVPLAVWACLGYVAVFGVVCLIQGVWQIVFGVRNKILMILMIVMAMILVGAGMFARAFK